MATQAYLRATPLNRKHLPLFLQVIRAAFSHEAQGELHFGKTISNSKKFFFLSAATKFTHFLCLRLLHLFLLATREFHVFSS